jgi:hypothetical protein
MPVASHPYYGPRRAQHRPRPIFVTSTHPHHPSSRYTVDAPTTSLYHTEAGSSPYQTSPSSQEHPTSWRPRTTTTESGWSVRTSLEVPISPLGYPYRPTEHVANQWPLRRHVSTTVPLPPQVSDEVDVIPLLKSGSGLLIDLEMSPATLHRRSSDEGWNNYWLEPATNPRIPSMSIVHPALPWAITVHRSSYEYVTVGDVMVKILEELAILVECKSGGPVCGDYGMRTRLDYLPGTKMVGLRKSRRGEDVWFMDVV